MGKKTTTKKRNPQDATLRNINALKKKVTDLQADFVTLEERVSKLEDAQHNPPVNETSTPIGGQS